MTDKRDFLIPTSFDVDSIHDSKQRKRVSDLIIAVEEGRITFNELLQRYSGSVKGEKIISEDYWDIPLVIASVFSIPRAEDINKSIENILSKIDSLEAKFRNHRHETGRTYSAKPEY